MKVEGGDEDKRFYHDLLPSKRWTHFGRLHREGELA